MHFGSGFRVAILLVVVAAFVSVSLSAAASPASDGKVLFEKDCTSCHSIGGGVKVGPDLKGVTSSVGAAWVQAFIAGPDKVIASGDARATALVKQFNGIKMPNMGLSSTQVASIVAYLDSQSGPAPAGTTPTSTTPAATQPAPTGSADAGKNDFTGATQLANGGAPCLSCHSIAGIGSLGGGALGPDLTGAYEKYGGASGVASVLAGLPFKTMTPIFAGHPLTAREQADLAAFLKAASTNHQRTSHAVLKLTLFGVLVAALCLGLAFVIWPRRRLVVRKRLVPPSTPFRRA